jgi:hypothetical protein
VMHTCASHCCHVLAAQYVMAMSMCASPVRRHNCADLHACEYTLLAMV